MEVGVLLPTAQSLPSPLKRTAPTQVFLFRKGEKKKKLNYVIPFFIKGVGYELNERFQSAVTAVRKVHVYNGSIAEKISAYSQLVQCVCDFSRIVKKYGELIIAEIPLPLDKKTIKPLPFYGGALLKGKYAQFKFSLLK